MTQRERALGARVELAAGMVAEAIGSGDALAAQARTRDLFHKAAELRRAQIARIKRNRAARAHSDVMRSIGMTRTAFGWE